MNIEIDQNCFISNEENIRDQIDHIFKDWDSEIISQEQSQKKILSEINSFDEQQIIQAFSQQKNRIQELQMYEQMNENHNNALKQLIQDKQSTQEQQMKFIKDQHSQEITMHQKNLEETLQKNLKTINTLVQDKKELSDQLEQLLEQLEKEKEQNMQKVKKIKQHYEQELKNQKDTILQKEKKDREKWQKDKQEKIRELTIKGLEPELQNLIEKQTLETKQLKLEYQQKLFKMRQELQAEQQLQLQQIKNSQLFFTNNIDFNQFTVNNNINTNNNLDNTHYDDNNNTFEKSPLINKNLGMLGYEKETKQLQSLQQAPQTFLSNQRQLVQNSYNIGNPQNSQIDEIKIQPSIKSAHKNIDNRQQNIDNKLSNIDSNIVYPNQSHFLFQPSSIQQNQQSQLPQLIVNNRPQNNFLTPHIKKKTIKSNNFNNS